jgi:6-pyruvoyltetrahydropterin/6-carboxytetrahydropterin synthase
MEVTVQREVPMGHRLYGYDGLCAFLHGHNYLFEVTIAGKPNDLGLVVDFKDLKNRLDEILVRFDHSMVLHEFDPSAKTLMAERVVLLTANPSAENLASLVFNALLDAGMPPTRVRVRETTDGWADATAVDRKVRIKSWWHGGGTS